MLPSRNLKSDCLQTMLQKLRQSAHVANVSYHPAFRDHVPSPEAANSPHGQDEVSVLGGRKAVITSVSRANSSSSHPNTPSSSASISPGITQTSASSSTPGTKPPITPRDATHPLLLDLQATVPNLNYRVPEPPVYGKGQVAAVNNWSQSTASTRRPSEASITGSPNLMKAFNSPSVTSITGSMPQHMQMPGFANSVDQMANGMLDFSMAGANSFFAPQADFTQTPQYTLPQFMNSPVAGVDPTQEDIWQDFMSHLGLNQG